MDIKPTGEALGAHITGIDLKQPVSPGDFKTILRALGEHGVIVFPRQTIETEDLVRFGKMFGDLEINVANQYHEPDHPEVMILSNMKKDTRPTTICPATSRRRWRAAQPPMTSSSSGT